MPVLAQSQQHIHRREARADEQHGFVGADAAQVAHGPRVGMVAGVGEVAQVGPGGRRGRKIAQGQHHKVTPDFGAIGQAHGAAAIGQQRRSHGGGGVQLHAAGGRGQHGSQSLVQVAAVGRARGKVGHAGGAFGLGGKPLRKVVGSFGIQTQGSVAYVEQVFGTAGGVGQAGSGNIARLNQVNFGLRQRRLPPQLQHQCRARKAAAHNGNNGSGKVIHGVKLGGNSGKKLRQTARTRPKQQSGPCKLNNCAYIYRFGTR